MEESKPVYLQDFVKELIGKVNDKKTEFNRYNSYGAVKLEDGSIVSINNNFFYLERLWQLYKIHKATKNKEELDKLLVGMNGGLFDSGDIVICLEDVKALFRTQTIANSSEEEKEMRLFKNSITFSVLDEILYVDGFDEEDSVNN